MKETPPSALCSSKPVVVARRVSCYFKLITGHVASGLITSSSAYLAFSVFWSLSLFCFASHFCSAMYFQKLRSRFTIFYLKTVSWQFKKSGQKVKIFSKPEIMRFRFESGWKNLCAINWPTVLPRWRPSLMLHDHPAPKPESRLGWADIVPS